MSPARAAIAASQSDCSIQSREVVLMLTRHTHYLFQVGRARAMESNQELLGIPGLKPERLKVVSAIFKGDVFAILPTGWTGFGKLFNTHVYLNYF